MQRNQEQLKRQKMINLKQRVTQSPFTLYKNYGKFPWQFMIHIILVFLTTYQFSKIITVRQNFILNEKETFWHIFVQNLESPEDANAPDVPFYNLESLQDHFRDLFNNVKNLNQLIFMDADTEEAEFNFDIFYNQVQTENHRGDPLKHNYGITLKQWEKNGLQEPFNYNDGESLKNFLSMIDIFQLEVSNIQTSGSRTRFDSSQCLKWKILLHYDFVTYSYIRVSFDLKPGFCENQSEFTQVDNGFVLHIIVIIFSGLSLFFGLNSFYNMWKNYQIYRLISDEKNKKQTYFKKLTRFQTMQRKGTIAQNKKFDEFLEMSSSSSSSSDSSSGSDSDDEKARVDRLFKFEKDFETLGLKDKLIFFDFWLLIGPVANLFQIIGSMQTLIDLLTPHEFNTNTSVALVGIGAAISWIVMVYYLKFNKNILGFLNALQISGNNLFWFTVGILPFFLGFVFLFECMFWRYGLFDSTGSSMTTLFSLMNGDIVNVTFRQILPEGFLGFFFLFVYIILFFTSAQNIFIVIIMEGYDKMVRIYKKQVQKQQDELKEEDEDIFLSEFQKKLKVQQELDDQDFALIKELQKMDNVQNDQNKEFIKKKIDMVYQQLKNNIRSNKHDMDMYLKQNNNQFEFEAESSLKHQAVLNNIQMLQDIQGKIDQKLSQFKNNLLTSNPELSISQLRENDL